MTREDKISEAQRLRDQGRPCWEIAGQLGVSANTISRWTNPEYAERNRAAARACKERYRGTCENCGGRTNNGSGPGRAPQYCTACHNRIVLGPKLRGRGLGGVAVDYLSEPRHLNDISRHLATSRSHTHLILHRLVRYGLVQRVSRGVYVATRSTA